MSGEKRCYVMPVTEHPAGSAMLDRPTQKAPVMKVIFAVLALGFAFATGMTVTWVIAEAVS